MNTLNSPVKNWQCLSTQIIYKSPYVLVQLDDVQLPNGSVIQFTRVDDRPFAIVVPTIADNLVMIYNYRYPLNEWCLEFPAGHIDPEETPQKAAQRELKEETGYMSKKLRLLSEFYPSVRSNQKAYVFTAKVSKKGYSRRNPSEFQRVVVLPRNEVYRKLKTGEIKHSASIVALAFAHAFLM